MGVIPRRAPSAPAPRLPGWKWINPLLFPASTGATARAPLRPAENPCSPSTTAEPVALEAPTGPGKTSPRCGHSNQAGQMRGALICRSWRFQGGALRPEARQRHGSDERHRPPAQTPRPLGDVPGNPDPHHPAAERRDPDGEGAPGARRLPAGPS